MTHPTHPPHCPHCNKSMALGFILDESHGQQVQQKWVPGAPTKAWWGGFRLKGLARLPVVSYRCPRCGLLYSYALEAGQR